MTHLDRGERDERAEASVAAEVPLALLLAVARAAVRALAVVLLVKPHAHDAPPAGELPTQRALQYSTLHCIFIEKLTKFCSVALMSLIVNYSHYFPGPYGSLI